MTVFWVIYSCTFDIKYWHTFLRIETLFGFFFELYVLIRLPILNRRRTLKLVYFHAFMEIFFKLYSLQIKLLSLKIVLWFFVAILWNHSRIELHSVLVYDLLSRFKSVYVCHKTPWFDVKMTYVIYFLAFFDWFHYFYYCFRVQFSEIPD